LILWGLRRRFRRPFWNMRRWGAPGVEFALAAFRAGRDLRSFPPAFVETFDGDSVPAQLADRAARGCPGQDLRLVGVPDVPLPAFVALIRDDELAGLDGGSLSSLVGKLGPAILPLPTAANDELPVERIHLRNLDGGRIEHAVSDHGSIPG
jgi:hypothetical protein